MNARACFAAALLILAAACKKEAPPPPPAVAAPVGRTFPVPAWAQDAIWYQVFVERFRNGDPRNDPTAHDIAGALTEATPGGWRITPWGQDWYKLDPWAARARMDFYRAAQFRRYGGDLKGVMDRLDYLQNLGVTALYLNPVNDAPSLHKYDARDWRHIDRNFGPDPRGDERRIAAENPGDTATWTWTAADSLFLALVREVHRRGMRIIMDYSWNHTGVTFWAWRDVLEHQRQSPYADWYAIDSFDDTTTADTNEFSYHGWAGVPTLPEIRKVDRPAGQTKGPIEGNLAPGPREHIFAVTHRWLDPNGDGDPSDGVDGFRLDVAEMVPLGFWRDYRAFVRGVNPQAYLVGEIWWDQWPDTMYDPAPWLRGDVFDAVMNYRWYAATRDFFLGVPEPVPPSVYAAQLDSLRSGQDTAVQRAMMDLTGSHDTPRFGTDILNRGRFKYHQNPREDPAYRLGRPDGTARAIQQLILVQQFTTIGAPHIYYGDEVGMWGADDPDERKPMVWSDLRYEDERVGPDGRARGRDRVSPDMGLFRVYQGLIGMRKAHQRLFTDGAMNWLITDDAFGLLAYERVLGNERVIVAFNASGSPHEIQIPAQGTLRQIWPAGRPANAINGILRTELLGRSARVWIQE